jgi:hypothetical protein
LKQGVSVFRNNQNKKKTNRNSSKVVKISTFLIRHTSSVWFGCFNTGLKQRNKPENFFFVFAKKQTKKQPKQIEFWFVSVRTEKKLTVSRTPNRRCLAIFSVCFDKVLFGSVVLKHRNKPKDMFFGFAKQTEKQPKQIEFRFVSVLTEKKI